MLTLCLVTLTFSFLTPPLQAADTLRKYKALNFPGDSESFITFRPDMSPFSEDFSFCGWLRKDGSSASWPILLSYGGNELRMQDDGGHSCIYGVCTRLASKFTVSLGRWFHYCATWGSGSRMFREYLEGEMIASRATTEGRYLQPGLFFTLGNWGEGGLESLQLEGQLFNFNFVAREFSREEVEERAGEMCELGEEEVYRLSWMDILGAQRNGTVSEVDTECLKREEVVSRMDGARRRVEQEEVKLDRVRKQLDNILEGVERDTRKILGTEEGQNISTQVELSSNLNKKRRELTRLTSLLNQVAEILQGGEKRDLSSEDGGTSYSERDRAASKWDILYSNSYFNKEFTRQHSDQLRSSWDKVCDKLVGVTITRELIELMKSLDSN
ncbi:hypothetical protein ACHWQZ_G003713 [Mnemiopsis leidyi]